VQIYDKQHVTAYKVLSSRQSPTEFKEPSMMQVLSTIILNI